MPWDLSIVRDWSTNRRTGETDRTYLVRTTEPAFGDLLRINSSAVWITWRRKRTSLRRLNTRQWITALLFYSCTIKLSSPMQNCEVNFKEKAHPGSLSYKEQPRFSKKSHRRTAKRRQSKLGLPDCSFDPHLTLPCRLLAYIWPLIRVRTLVYMILFQDK
jgi:hypothetical protein